MLEGDHVWPYSLFGASVWENYQLLCGGCNIQKSNRISIYLRDLLGGDDFRKSLQEFLRGRCTGEQIQTDPLLSELLSFAVRDTRGP